MNPITCGHRRILRKKSNTQKNNNNSDRQHEAEIETLNKKAAGHGMQTVNFVGELF